MSAESAQEGGVLGGAAVRVVTLLAEDRGWGCCWRLVRQFRAQALDLLVGRCLSTAGDVWFSHRLLLAFCGHRGENVSILLFKHLYQVLNLYSVLSGRLLLELRRHAANCHIRGPTRRREQPSATVACLTVLRLLLLLTATRPLIQR